MHIGRGQVDDYLFSRHVKPFGLQGRDGPEKTLLDGGIGQPYQMDTYSEGNFHLYGDGNGLDAHALGSVNVDQHSLFD